MRRAAAIVLALAACSGKRDDFGPKFYSHPGDRVLCSKGADRSHTWTLDTLKKSLDVAKADGDVLQTYAHAPSAENSGIDVDEMLPMFDYAYDSKIPMVTFTQVADGYDAAGWSFSIDDNDIDVWFGWRDKLNAHHAKLTFFVSRYDKATPEQKAKLKQLAADGHDIQAHGIAHLDAKLAVQQNGLGNYLETEVKPSVALLVADGYHPVAFAYPYGSHTNDLDVNMLALFKVLRTTGNEHCF